MIRRLALIVLLLLPAADARASNEDPWWGKDKALHFGFSAGLAGAGYGLSSLWFEDTTSRLLAGAGLALGAGVAKELHDLGGAGDPSYRDLTWDVIGTGVGLTLAWLLDRSLRGQPERESAAHVGPQLTVRPLHPEAAVTLSCPW